MLARGTPATFSATRLHHPIRHYPASTTPYLQNTFLWCNPPTHLDVILQTNTSCLTDCKWRPALFVQLWYQITPEWGPPLKGLSWGWGLPTFEIFCTAFHVLTRWGLRSLHVHVLSSDHLERVWWWSMNMCSCVVIFCFNLVWDDLCDLASHKLTMDYGPWILQSLQFGHHVLIYARRVESTSHFSSKRLGKLEEDERNMGSYKIELNFDGRMGLFDSQWKINKMMWLKNQNV